MSKRYKGFSFTYSKIKNFEQCGFQHQKVDIERRPGLEPSGDAIDYGNRVHAALKSALKDGTALVPAMRHLQFWVDWAKEHPGTHYIEEKWAISRDYQESEFFSNFAWMRLIVDFAAVFGPVGWLVDWKTGNRLEEPLQLWLGAAVMFAKFPDLKVVKSMFVWLKEDDGTNQENCVSVETIKREQIGEIWESLMPRISAYETAIATNRFVPSPGRHCRYCRVQECEFFGKGIQ